MTPQTQMLYAYTESPLLKTDNQAVAFKNINSKKMLNFELDINQKENLMKAQLKHSQPQIEKIMENYNGGLQETNDFINKKCNAPALPLIPAFALILALESAAPLMNFCLRRDSL